MTEFMLHSISKMYQALNNKEISSVELCQTYLNRIKNSQDKLNAFIDIYPEPQIMAMALRADTYRQKNVNHKTHPLLGIPIAHKDIFCTREGRTTCGSKMLENFIAPYNATVVEKLSAAGMVTLGKTNMDEFAMGSSNETSFFGHVKNPWSLAHVPGGSSGGSAAAVAARLIPAATGTDTGGSIRQPASHCGISGIKPTYGRVSRWGMIAFASSLDQAGPMAASVEDLAYLLEAMSGHDPKDSTCATEPVPQYHKNIDADVKGKVFGIPAHIMKDLDPDVAQCFDKSRQLFESLGCIFKDIELPHHDLATPAYYCIAPAECSSNLARYDGIRYGYRSQLAHSLEQMYVNTRTEGFGLEVKRRILTGTHVLSSGYYDAYYHQARKIRRLIQQDYLQAFAEVDALLMPVTPTPAFKINEKINDPIAMYHSDYFTLSANLAGLPGLAIPAGFSANKLPIGIQLVGNCFCESLLLNLGHQFQLISDHHLQQSTCFSHNEDL